MTHVDKTDRQLSTRHRRTQAQRKRLKRERTAAKNSMVVSLGALVLTGYFISRGRRADATTYRTAHMIAGVALLGTSYWHATLYGADRTPPK